MDQVENKQNRKETFILIKNRENKSTKSVRILYVFSAMFFISIAIALFFTIFYGNVKKDKSNNLVTNVKVASFGVFTCSVFDSKSTYCPGDEISFTLSSDQTTLYDLSLLFNCQVRGPPTAFANASIVRPSGPRGFIDNCNPILQDKNFTQFIVQGNTGVYIVSGTANYIGFSQQINIYFFNNDTVGTSSNFLHNAVCPSFQVSDCNVNTATTITSVFTSTKTSTSTPTLFESETFTTENIVSTGIVSSTSTVINYASKSTLSLSSVFLIFVFMC